MLSITWLKDLGVQIRVARERADLSQVELAKHLSVSRAQLSNYENGKCPPNVHVVTEIAEALGVDLIVRGYIISPMSPTGAKAKLVEQLCFPFDVERRFPAATVTIEPSRDSIVITAILPHRAG